MIKCDQFVAGIIEWWEWSTMQPNNTPAEGILSREECENLLARANIYPYGEFLKLRRSHLAQADRIAELEALYADDERLLEMMNGQIHELEADLARVTKQRDELARTLGEPVKWCARCEGTGQVPGGTEEYPASGCCLIDRERLKAWQVEALSALKDVVNQYWEAHEDGCPILREEDVEKLVRAVIDGYAGW